MVSNKPSEYSTDRGLRINIQDNLERYYQQMFPDRQPRLRQELEGDIIKFDFLSISFMRTVRVPDGEEINDLPAGLGRFPLFNVSDFEDELPLDVVEKGGIFLPIYSMYHCTFFKTVITSIIIPGINGSSCRT